MFDALKRVRAWIPIDGTYDLGPGPRQSKEEADWRYSLSRCMTCGCCLEACPNYNDGSSFIGPAAINQALLFNIHPTGRLNQDERIAAVVAEGGIQCCGNAQNCVEVCPKDIPLTASIGYIGRQATGYMFRRWFRR
jgi:succinate dehydrogenase / fumarate reductase iron-sulfur subunit